MTETDLVEELMYCEQDQHHRICAQVERKEICKKCRRVYEPWLMGWFRED